MLWAMHTLGILRLIIINEKADFFQLGNNSIKYNDYDRYSIKYKPLKLFLVTTLFTLLISGCYTIGFFHDTDLLREKHDGEINSFSIPNVV